MLRAEIDLSSLPATTPRPVRRLLGRCLDRDSSTRLRDAGEARIVLAAPRAPTEETSGEARRGKVFPAVAMVIALLAGLAIGRLAFGPSPSPRPDFAFEIALADHEVLTGSMSLSPDGARLVFLVLDEAGSRQLWLRALNSFEARPLPGTQGASDPFWSPDGQEIAFFADGQLLRVALDGTPPRKVAAAPRAVGGTWNARDVILFGGEDGPIFRVSATGGRDPVAITELEQTVEDSHVWPVFFADGQRFFFLADAATDEGHRVRLGTIDGGGTEVLLTTVRSNLSVDPRGALLLVRDNQLVAYRFEPSSGRLTGDPTIIVDSVYPLGGHHHAPFSVSANGTLAYQRGSDQADLVQLDLNGAILGGFETSERFGNPEFSPDGRHIAFDTEPSSDEWLVWVSISSVASAP